MSRYLNKVILIGNVTDDIEVENVSDEDKICRFFVATNRSWTSKDGTKSEDTEYHRIVAWNKLAIACGQFLNKGSKIYVEGRLSTYKYLDKEGNPQTSVEIIVNDFISLD